MDMEELPYWEAIRSWLEDRYGPLAGKISRKVRENYDSFLHDSPDYGGRNSGHARAIYGGLLIFAWYSALPDQPPVSELQEFVSNLFMGSFTKLGKIFDLNRSFDMRLIDWVFRRSGNRDRRDLRKYPNGFVNEDEPYDPIHQAARYSFTRCPNAEFAKAHGLLHVLPLLCNSDYFGISEIHGTLIRRGTCGNSSRCDYCVVGNQNPMAKEYEIIADANGFLISRRKGNNDDAEI